MMKMDFDNLDVGDIVRSPRGEVYVVTGNYGDHVTAVRTVDMTNHCEWNLVSKVEGRRRE